MSRNVCILFNTSGPQSQSGQLCATVIRNIFYCIDINLKHRYHKLEQLFFLNIKTISHGSLLL